MNFLSNLYRGLQSLFRKRLVDREFDEELAAFADASAADKERTGMSREAALRAARIEIGSVASVKHKVWSARWESIPENLLKDLRFAVRLLLRSPAFAFIAILSLTLGIGANTAIFTLLNAILLRPLPVQNPRELVLFGDGKAQGSTGSVPDGSTEAVLLSVLSRLSAERYLVFRHRRGRQHPDGPQGFDCRRSLPNDARRSCLRQLLLRSWRAGVSRPHDWRIRRLASTAQVRSP